MSLKSFIFIAVLGIFRTMTLLAQDSTSPKHACGANILLSTNGVGLGAFYRHEYTDNLSGIMEFSISDAADDNEVEYIDYYTYQTFTPGKVNRFLVLPLYIGVQQRLFKDDIMDNFRPHIDAAVGPTMIYVFPYDLEYFQALGKGQPKYTIGGFIGGGVYFGSERSNLLGLNVRYYFVPYNGGIRSMTNTIKKQFGGFYISLSFGSAW